MQKKFPGMLCLWCALLSLPAFAQSPAASLSEQSSAKARAVLEASITAMGGLDALKAVNNISRVMEGVRTDEGQGLQPIVHRSNYFETVAAPVVNRPKVHHINDQRGQRIAESREGVILGGQPVQRRSILAEDTLFALNPELGTFEAAKLPNPTLARANRLSRYPENLLPQVWERPEALRYLGESHYKGRKQRVIAYANQNGAQITLYFDAQTKLLTKSEMLSDHPILGDMTDEVVYDDWRRVGKLTLPFRYVDKAGGVMLQDLRASSITVDTKLDESLFAVPSGLTKMERTPLARKPTPLGKDVFLVPGAYNSIVVNFNDYLLVLEAGSDNQTTENVLAQIKEIIAPGKPIRYLVSTHFHFDHIGGVRSYIAEGTTIITTPGARQIIEQAAAAVHRRRPDALSRNPRAPVIETLQGHRVFDDGTHRVELYEFANPHCAEMIVAWLPQEKILFEADMLDITYPGYVGTGGADTAALRDKIQSLGLAVERIIPVHGHPGTMDDLRRAVAGRAADK